jgi:hypothetical protein
LGRVTEVIPDVSNAFPIIVTRELWAANNIDTKEVQPKKAADSRGSSRGRGGI